MFLKQKKHEKKERIMFKFIERFIKKESIEKEVDKVIKEYFLEQKIEDVITEIIKKITDEQINWFLKRRVDKMIEGVDLYNMSNHLIREEFLDALIARINAKQITRYDPIAQQIRDTFGD